MAYGNSKSCFKFCKDIVEHSEKFKKNIREEYAKRKCVWYHDQEFLLLNYKKLNYKIRTGYVALYNYGMRQEEANLLHVAYISTTEAKSKFEILKNINNSKLRISFVKNILNGTNVLSEQDLWVNYDELVRAKN